MPCAPPDSVLNLSLSQALAGLPFGNKNETTAGHPAVNKNETVERAMMWRAKLRQQGGHVMVAAEEAFLSQKAGASHVGDMRQAPQSQQDARANILHIPEPLRLQDWQNQTGGVIDGHGIGCAAAGPLIDRTLLTGRPNVGMCAGSARDICAHVPMSEVAHCGEQDPVITDIGALGSNSMISTAAGGQEAFIAGLPYHLGLTDSNAPAAWDFPNDCGYPSWYGYAPHPENVHQGPDVGYAAHLQNVMSEFDHTAAIPGFAHAHDLPAFEMQAAFHQGIYYQEALAATLSAAQPDHYED